MLGRHALRDPYILTHIRNADFAQGLEGWNVAPAEEGSIATGSMKVYGSVQGRWRVSDKGDTFAAMKRCAGTPNTLSQTVRDLQPGRLYSVKAITADPQDLDRRQKHAVTVNIDGADVLGDRCFQSVFSSIYSRTQIGGYDYKLKSWLNYHWIVFRATTDSAKLTISDWAGLREPGGPAGQELAVNFVEIQPYLP